MVGAARGAGAVERVDDEPAAVPRRAAAPAAAAGQRERRHQHDRRAAAHVSTTSVTGPSLTSETSMRAPKAPRSAPSCSQKRS